MQFEEEHGILKEHITSTLRVKEWAKHATSRGSQQAPNYKVLQPRTLYSSCCFRFLFFYYNIITVLRATILHLKVLKQL
jgi:hypothetical protein